MEEGQYASFHAQSPKVKLGIMEINSEGEEVLLYGGLGMALDEKFVVVAEKAGMYQFDISTPQKAPEAQYTFEMTELRTATEDEKGLQLALDLYTKGVNLDRAGKFAEAELFFDRALEIQKRIAGPDSYQVAKTLSYISSTHSNRGDYGIAIDLETQALRIQEKIYGKDDPRVAQSNYEIGMMVIDKGDTVNAQRYFLESLDVLKRGNHADSVVGYLDYLMLGDISYSLGDLKKANDLLKQSLAISEKLFGPDHYHLADVLLEIGHVALESGDVSSAEAAAKRALANTEKQYGSEHWRDVFPLNDLGRIYSTSGEPAKAEQMYERAFAINETVLEAGGLHVNETLAGLVRVYAAQGMMPKALTYQTRVSENEERLIGMNLLGGSEREKLAFVSTLSPLISQNISLHIQLAPEAPAFRDLALTTILRRKGRVQDFLAYGNEAALERLSPDDRKLAMQFNDATGKLSSLVLRGPENMDVTEYQKKVKEMENSREQLESEIGRRNIRALRRPTPVTIEDVKKHIPDDAALVEYAVYTPYDIRAIKYAEPRYAVYVLRRNGEIGWKDLGAAKDIDESIEALRLSLRDPKREDTVRLARAVDAKVMRPVRDLAGNASHLLVSPDGELNVIPLGSLVDEHGKYAVENYSFTYLSSGRDLVRMGEKKSSETGPLVIGNPAYGEPEAAPAAESRQKPPRRPSIAKTRDLTDTYFAPLGGTEQEARAIKSLFPDANYLTGAQATETSLKQAKAPRILHIATHGFFLADRNDNSVGETREKHNLMLPDDIEDPLLRSGLALAGANRRTKSDDDGLLTALEASGLDLWGTQLVVLSACDTGLGEIRNGEGVFGLRRSFGIAGAESIVMSLWPVSDQITRDMMISYYKYLKKGVGRGEALRRVQLEMLNRSGHNHPFYWASFIQSGDWTEIK